MKKFADWGRLDWPGNLPAHAVPRQDRVDRRGSSFPVRDKLTPDSSTNLAALQLTEEGYGNIACVALLAIGAEGSF